MSRRELGIEELIEQFQRRFEEAQESLGRFNLAVFGKTGVGKSTLINTVFSANVARTGNGRPVTEGVDHYPHPSGFFGVFDSEGIQTGEQGDAVLDRFAELIAERRSRPVAEQIHVIWYCVRWSDRRFEDSQAEFVEALAAEGVPVMFVMTQVPLREGEVHPDALELAEDVIARGLPLAPENRVFFTMALEDEFSGHPAHGLQELLDATFRVAPEGVNAAITAAQQIDVDRKIAEARKLIKPVAAAAGGVGATPIPFADAAILIPVQIGLMARIAAIFGLPIDKGNLATIAAVALAGGGVTRAARYVVTNLVKALPGGAIAGGVIRAGVASTLTYALGEAWISVCGRLYRMGPDAASRVSPEEIRRLFMDEFRRRAASGERG
jgi:uncharacterized protein (DUF697 family)